MLKINFKERFKNKAFVLTFIALVVAFVYQILGMFGIVPSVSEDEIMQTTTMLVNILALIGVIIDPTTSGISDSERAMTYGTPEDKRKGE